ncbi:MAG: HDOD domain-containing protein [Proteobacteria bacterium]|nr:HDOD domain-containing protein [Pseudomonadota bacterium]
MTGAVVERIGRFELRRVLGQGAQATVWLAHDARLDREVAVKLLPADSAAAYGTLEHRLGEARSVSRLHHPHIVQVFEADVDAGRPYLVFEYVAGPTLAQYLKGRGAMPPHEAVAMMLGVLDALHAAHAAGVVHRDLKPSNILVDGSGRARVMDFGIAARVQDPNATRDVVGTPGYMSPEAVDGAPPAPAMDIYSAGLVLAEMLAGERLIAERDPYRAMARAVHEDVRLPETLSSAVDDTLRAVLLRAVARRPAERWPDAQAFRNALRDWLAPELPAQPAEARAAGAGGATLDFLLRRMRHKSDFPAMSDAVARIQRVTSSENESLGSLSNEILKDVALTNKLLRLVNTAHYSNAGGGSISTVSRAVALIGFAGIRNLALSLVLLEHMHDRGHASQLKEEFLRALMAGTLASELGLHLRVGEEAFIGAMFQNLGRLLAEYYFPEEARRVRGLVTAAGGSGEAAAAVGVLGLSYEELGVGVARSWGLPEAIQRCMRKAEADPPTRLADPGADQLRWLAAAANRITEALLCAEPEAARARVQQIAKQFTRALGLPAEQIEAATETARQRLVQLAQAMHLGVPPGAPARRLLGTDNTAAATRAAVPDDSLKPHELQATIAEPREPAPNAQRDAAEVLAAGIQDITNTMVESFKLNEVLRMILETMYRALGFRRIVFCLRDPKTGTLTGRFGLGDGAERVAACFKVPLKVGGDLFAAVCIKGADTLISDATVPNIAARLPAWYRADVNAPAFLLLPMLLKGAPFALIYADRGEPGGIEIGEKELSLVRTLRNQAVMAFKQVG